LRKGAKLLIFYAISFAIANTFLAYIIGSDELFKIISEPVSEHIGGFIAINLFTVVFFLVFARFREQVCHFACPYGRFQSALVDNDTISVTYDFKRGEKRGTLGARKKAGFPLTAAAPVGASSQTLPASATEQAPFGDCIDCGSCVVVCPSGIDIRNGIQLECVQCTACIDACDKMMDAVGKPRGLIRYTSYNAVKTGKNTLFKFRTAGYLAVWLLVLSIFLGLLLTREQIETVLLRQPGMLAQRLPDGYIGNMYSLKVFNKTFEPQKTDIRLSPEFADKGEIRFIDTIGETAAQNYTQVRFLVALKPEAIGTVNLPIEFDILLNGQLLRKKQTVFIAPGK
jgi:cytochrome c oxidase accessory protein FixG